MNVKKLKKLEPLQIKETYTLDYTHSYGQDSPYFIGLANKQLFGTRCEKCRFTYSTPRLHCMKCGKECDWVKLPHVGKVHTWTTCYFGSEEFLKETPFHLILVEFPRIQTLLLSRLKIGKKEKIKIGMKVKAQFKSKPQFKASDLYFIPCFLE